MHQKRVHLLHRSKCPRWREADRQISTTLYAASAKHLSVRGCSPRAEPSACRQWMLVLRGGRGVTFGRLFCPYYSTVVLQLQILDLMMLASLQQSGVELARPSASGGRVATAKEARPRQTSRNPGALMAETHNEANLHRPRARRDSVQHGRSLPAQAVKQRGPARSAG